MITAKLSPRFRKYFRPIGVVCLFAVLGMIILLSVRAAVTFISAEPEAGNLNRATVGSNNKASGGKFIKFDGGKVSGAGMSVSGNQLLKDGQPFMPRGFNMIGLLSSPGCGTFHGDLAAKHFDDTEMMAARNDWNANTLRFQVNQGALAANDRYEEYVDTVIVPRVKLALSHDFVVIMSMMDKETGCGDTGTHLPIQATVDAWVHLATRMKEALSAAEYRNVMHELFNEPRGAASPGGWDQWLNGGVGGDKPVTLEQNGGKMPIGHQALVDAVRSTGSADNVLVAEGMLLGKRLNGMPMLNDPAGKDQIAYAFHGYNYWEYADDWDERFGYLTATKPVIMTEWHYGFHECGQIGEAMAPEFLQYVRDHNIGMTPGPFDNPASTGLVYNWEWTPTDCANTGDDYRGSGQLVKDQYADMAAEETH